MGLMDFLARLIRLAFFAFWAKVTENYGEKPSHEADQRYPVQIPEEYMRENLPTGFGNYRWEPVYKTDVNHLYNNENAFKYKKPKEY